MPSHVRSALMLMVDSQGRIAVPGGRLKQAGLLWAAVVLGLLFSLGPSQAQKSEYKIDGRTGVRIAWGFNEEIFLPSMLQPPVSAKATRLADKDVPGVVWVLQFGLRKYPAHFFDGYLKCIYVFENLTMENQRVGGGQDVDNQCVYVTTYDTEHAFHHELCHILTKRFYKLISTEEWDQNNPPGFHYGKGGSDAIRNGKASTAIEEPYLSQGFLNEYCTSARNEEFSCLAEGLFEGGTLFWNAVDTHPVIARKMRLLIKFYHDLDPLFTEQYFRDLCFKHDAFMKTVGKIK